MFILEQNKISFARAFRPIGLLGLLALAIVMGTTGCGPRGNDSPDAGRREIKATTTMEPEPLALAGEQLVAPGTFMLADKVFDMALAKDPGNYRAHFYKAVLKPLMVFEGVNRRLRPYVIAKGDIRKFDRIAANMPNSPLLDFMLNGREDISSVEGVQNLVDQYISAMVELYDFLKVHEEQALVINLNPHIWEQKIQHDTQDNCSIVRNDKEETRVECDLREILQRKMSLADMIALRQNIAGMILYAIIYNSYTLEGAEDLLRLSQESSSSKSSTPVRAQPPEPMPRSGPETMVDSRPTRTPAEVFNRLENLPKFGLLRPTNKLKALRKFGADFSAAWKYVRDNQRNLCPATKYPWERRRKGHVFENGICIDGVNSEDEKNIALLDQLLSGPGAVLVGTADGRKLNVMLDAFRVSDQPVANLKSLFPSQYNRCGQAIALHDPTFGGVLPNGDGNLFLSQDCPQ
jgi:hypothetical protein